MINEQKIPCPVCKVQIPFDVESLLKGAKFSCSSCGAVVSIAPESVEFTTAAMENYQALKINHGKTKK